MNQPIALPIPAHNGEQMLLQASTRYLLTTPAGWGYNPINGQLTLTNQRLVFRPYRAVTPMQGVILGAAGASIVWFPIRRVTACSEQPMKVQWGKPNVVKLVFDNGGREYFVIPASEGMPSGTWVAALINAKAAAPALAYDRMPALKSGFELPAYYGTKRLLLYWMLAVVGLCMLCSVAALIFDYFST